MDLELDRRSPNGVTTARACLFRRPSLPPCPHRIPAASRSLFHKVPVDEGVDQGVGESIGRRRRTRPSWRGPSAPDRAGRPTSRRVLAKYVVVTRNAPGCRNVDLAASIATPGPVPRDREVGRRRRPGRPPRLGRDGRDGDRREPACSPARPISTSTPRSRPTTSADPVATGLSRASASGGSWRRAPGRTFGVGRSSAAAVSAHAASRSAQVTSSAAQRRS